MRDMYGDTLELGQQCLAYIVLPNTYLSGEVYNFLVGDRVYELDLESAYELLLMRDSALDETSPDEIDEVAGDVDEVLSGVSDDLSDNLSDDLSDNIVVTDELLVIALEDLFVSLGMYDVSVRILQLTLDDLLA